MRTTKVLALALVAVLATGGVANARGGGHGGGHSSSRSHSSSSGHVNSSYHSVHSYTRSNGTHVSGYRATDPNHTRNDNYSTRGNTNPWTGKYGSKPRDGEH